MQATATAHSFDLLDKNIQASCLLSRHDTINQQHVNKGFLL
jgi:hypothetical protein